MRATVIILEIKEKQNIMTKQGKSLTKLAFKAREGDKEFMYFTLLTRLMNYIQRGETLDIEYDVKEREHDGNLYVDRCVTQVYRDADLAVNRGQGFKNNTEVQTAVKAVTELQVTGLEVPGDLITARDNWLRMILTTVLSESKREPRAISEPVPPVTSTRMKTVGDLLTACHDQWGMNRTQVLRELGVSDIKSLNTPLVLEGAYSRIKETKAARKTIVAVCFNGHESKQGTPVCKQCGATTEERQVDIKPAEKGQDTAQIAVMSLQEREAILFKWLAKIKVTTKDEQKACEEMLIHARSVKKEAEIKMDELLKPGREEQKRISNHFKPFLDKLIIGIDSVNKALQVYHDGQQRMAGEERLKVLIQQTKVIADSKVTGEVVKLPKEVLPVVAKTSRSNMGSVTYRDDFTIEIVNPDLVPRDLCEPSMTKIRARIRSGIKDLPGVVIIPKYTTVTRRN